MLPKSLSWHGVRFLHLLEKLIIKILLDHIHHLLTIILIINGFRLKRALRHNEIILLLLPHNSLPFLCPLMIDQQIRMGDLPTSFIQLFFHLFVHIVFTFSQHLFSAFE